MYKIEKPRADPATLTRPSAWNLMAHIPLACAEISN